MNFRNWFDRYSTDCKLKYSSEQTRKVYKSCVGVFLNYFDKYREPKEIPTQEIKEWLLKAATINTRKHRLCAVKSFYELTVGMPAKLDKIPYPRKDKKLPIVLSQPEVQRMFESCENLKHKTILALMYATGLRISEVINLRIKDIDSSQMVINIIAAKGKKDRQVMLPKSLLQLLREYFKKYKPKEFLFNGQQDSPQYSVRSINLFLQALAAKAGIKSKHVHAHLMRHTSFTHMVENGTDINLIQRLAGHSNVRTTNQYCHVSNNLISKIPSPIDNIKL